MASGVPIIKSEEEVALCRQSSLLVEQALALVASRLKPGVTGLEVDAWVDTFIQDHQAKASFKGFHGFPFRSPANRASWHFRRPAWPF